jgi:hypothetical protein
MTSNAQHCSFVLLAEFDIDRGAQLTYQFPQPLGTDEGYAVMWLYYVSSWLTHVKFFVACHAQTACELNASGRCREAA